MSENIQESAPTSTSIINLVVESVMDLIDGLNLYAKITRGALETDASISCEVAPSNPEMVFMDKNIYLPIDLTLNAKHENLQTVSDALNTIHEYLTFLKSYPYGTNWEIVDIVTQTEPQIIERQTNNMWVMASDLLVKIRTMKEVEATNESELGESD